MFWALVIEPNKRYTQVVSKSFHVSMACMDLDTADPEVTSVMLEVGDEKLILCNLNKNKYIQQPLDLNFQVGDEISFYTKGKASVHLTGYLIIGEDFPGLSDQESEDDEEEEEDEDAKERLKAMATKAMKRGIEEKSSKNKKPKLDSSVGEEDSDEDDEDFELDESSEESGEEAEQQAASDSDEDDDSDEGMNVSVEMKKGKKEVGGKKEAAKKATPMKKEGQEKGGDKKNESVNGTPTVSAKKKKQKDGATPKVKGTPKSNFIKQSA